MQIKFVFHRWWVCFVELHMKRANASHKLGNRVSFGCVVLACVGRSYMYHDKCKKEDENIRDGIQLLSQGLTETYFRCIISVTVKSPHLMWKCQENKIYEHNEFPLFISYYVQVSVGCWTGLIWFERFPTDINFLLQFKLNCCCRKRKKSCHDRFGTICQFSTIFLLSTICLTIYFVTY